VSQGESGRPGLLEKFIRIYGSSVGDAGLSGARRQRATTTRRIRRLMKRKGPTPEAAMATSSSVIAVEASAATRRWRLQRRNRRQWRHWANMEKKVRNPFCAAFEMSAPTVAVGLKRAHLSLPSSHFSPTPFLTFFISAQPKFRILHF
jgi:hypothetical protein